MGPRTSPCGAIVVMGMLAGLVAGRFESGIVLEGLDGPATTRTWLGRNLGDHVERAFMGASISFLGDEPLPEEKGRFLVRSDVVLTSDAVAAFADLAGEQDIAWSMEGRLGNFISDLCFGDEGPWLVYLAPGGAVTPERIAAAVPTGVDPKERMLEFPLSEEHHGASVVELPISDRLVMPTGHWLQLLWANLLGLGPFLWRNLMGRNIIEVFARGVWTALKAGSLRPHRIGAQLGRQGKDCRIHPTAVVEGCWLADNVEIGANAVVRGSVLGVGTVVEDLALVEFSVTGQGARIQRQAMVKFSLLSPLSAAGGLMQLGVLGRASALKRTGVLMDVSFGQGVQVEAHGKRYPAPLNMAGVCLGDGSTVGAGVSVAAGRCVPRGVQIVPSSANLVTRIPDGLTGLVAVKDGSLESL
jgi:hypothetical protein